MSASRVSPLRRRDAAARRSEPSRGSRARFSFRVPSVRGSSAVGQTDAVRMR